MQWFVALFLFGLFAPAVSAQEIISEWDDPAWSDAEGQAHGWYLSSGPSKIFLETLEHVRAISVASRSPQITSNPPGYDNFKLSHGEPPMPHRTCRGGNATARDGGAGNRGRG